MIVAEIRNQEDQHHNDTATVKTPGQVTPFHLSGDERHDTNRHRIKNTQFFP